MSEMTKQITARNAWARVVCNAGRIHGPRAAIFLAGSTDGLEGFDGNQVGPFINALCRSLDNATDRMVASEKRYTQDRSEDVAARDRRDDAYTIARDTLSGVRGAAESILGPKGLRTYGIPSPLPRTPDQLITVLSNTIHLLNENPVNTSNMFGQTFDSAHMVALLTPLHDELRAAVEFVATESRETERAMLERNEAVADWERVYRGTAGVLSHFFLLSGMPEQASRVRPTIRRTSGLDIPEPTPQDVVEPAGEDVLEPTDA